MKLPRKNMLSHHHQQGNTATFCGQGKFEVFWCHIMDLLEVGGLSWGCTFAWATSSDSCKGDYVQNLKVPQKIWQMFKKILHH